LEADPDGNPQEGNFNVKKEKILNQVKPPKREGYD
jgi:hypothetical protein